MKQQIWVFDFDKTLTRRDTTLPFLVFGCGPMSRLIRTLHYYLLAIAVKLRLIDHGDLKDRLFSAHFGGWTPDQWQDHAGRFAAGIEFSGLYRTIDWNCPNREMWIVSASPADVLRHCFPATVKVLGSEMAFGPRGLENLSVHMHGEAKQQALRQEGLDRFDRFYSDHWFDAPLAAMAKEIFLVKGDQVTPCNNMDDFVRKAKGKRDAFPLTSCPPARTTFGMLRVIKGMGDAGRLEEDAAAFLGVRKVMIGDAWVNMLAEGLRCMAQARNRHEVILPGYSCNEFTKAIFLAGLRPVYAPLDTHCRLEPAAVEGLFTADTLGILAVNNTGVVSDMTALRALCERHACWLVEDAGYSFLGTDDTGRPYGSLGHAAIINMSEGKTIPCGGAAWAINDEEIERAFAPLADRLARTQPRDNWREFLSLAVYRLGSSIPGFSLYRFLKLFAGQDLKSLLSAEPSRHAENYATGNLLWENDRVALDPEHAGHLEAITIRPWNKVRKSCALQILQGAESIRRKRKQRLQQWKEALGDTFKWLELPDNCMPVKQPFLLPSGLFTEGEIERLSWQGIKKQYPPTWPMAALDFENDRLYYEQAFTLPLHDGVSTSRIQKMASILLLHSSPRMEYIWGKS